MPISGARDNLAWSSGLLFIGSCRQPAFLTLDTLHRGSLFLEWQSRAGCIHVLKTCLTWLSWIQRAGIICRQHLWRISFICALLHYGRHVILSFPDTPTFSMLCTYIWFSGVPTNSQTGKYDTPVSVLWATQTNKHGIEQAIQNVATVLHTVKWSHIRITSAVRVQNMLFVTDYLAMWGVYRT